MKTVFQRVMSVILCVILVMSTVSVSAFAADEFKYGIKYFTQQDSSVGAKKLVDEINKNLADANVYEKIVLIKPNFLDKDGVSIVIDMTSIDKVCKTIDDFELIITIAKAVLGDLKSLTLKNFQNGMSRSKSGDIKIIEEFIELIADNRELISKVIDGSLDLGLIGDALDVDIGEMFGPDGIEGMVKKTFISLVYGEGTKEFNEAYERSKTDFDSFIYGDFLRAYISGDDGVLPGFTMDGSSNVNDLVSNTFTQVLNMYLMPFIQEFDIDLTQYGDKLGDLAGMLNLKGSTYDFSNIKFEKGKSILEQINGVIGQISAQIVPGYKGWAEGDYTKIGQNMENIFRYLAKGSNLVGNADGMSFEELVISVVKSVAQVADFGEISVLGEGLESCTTLEQIAKVILVNAADEMGIDVTYTKEQTYLHVLGDVIAWGVYDYIKLTDTSGKEYRAGGGKDFWDVLNYVFNYFLFDRGYATLLGKSTNTLKKTDSVFTKIDKFADMFGENGNINFDSKNFLMGDGKNKGLIESIFTLDIQHAVEMTAVKALDKAGNVPIVEFIYKSAEYFLKNWAGKQVLKPYSSVAPVPFTKSFSNENLASALKVMLETVNARRSAFVSSFARMIGLYMKEDIKLSTSVTIADYAYTGKTAKPAATVTAGGKKLTQGTDYIVETSSVNLGKATATVKGIGYYEGKIKDVPYNIVLGTPGAGKFTATTSSVRLTWNAVYGAKSYNVYLGSSSTPVKSVTTTSCDLTGLKAGTKYNYKVEAISGSFKSAKTDIKTVTAPVQVSGLNKTSVADTSVKLSWNAVSGAAGYYVQQQSGSTWKTVSTAKTNSATVSGLKANTSYKFRVVAFSKSDSNTQINGTASAVLTVKTVLSKPSSLKVSAKTSTTVTLAWSKVTGAAGYLVQRYVSGAWKNVKTTTGASLKVSGLTANKEHKFRVCAYTKSGSVTTYGVYTSAVSGTTNVAKPSGAKASSPTSTTLKVSWKKVTGATGYQVYAYIGKKWKKVATTSKTSATIKELKANTTYKIKVRAYKKSGKTTTYGDYTSEFKGTTAVAKVSIKAPKAGSKQMTVSWGKVSSASGYEVTYSTSKSFTKKTTKTVTIKKGKTVKTTIKKLTKGKKYYVKVRAYKTVNKKKVYGNYSSVKSITIK